MICNEDPEVRANYNADGNFTNYIYCADCSYYNDFDENCIVFVWGEGDITITPALAKGSTSGKTKVTSASVTVPGGSSCYAKVGTSPVAVAVGEEFDNTGWTACTPGTTEFSVTAGQYITLVIYDTTTTIVQDTGYVKVTAGDIGS